jgi:hypothetical protein
MQLELGKGHVMQLELGRGHIMQLELGNQYQKSQDILAGVKALGSRELIEP